MRPQVAAMARIPSKYANPAVVEFTGITREQINVIAATTTRLASRRKANTSGRTRIPFKIVA
jgi:hypothetical protein